MLSAEQVQSFISPSSRFSPNLLGESHWRPVSGVYVWWTGGSNGEPLRDGLLDHRWFENENGDILDYNQVRLPDKGRGMYVAD